jgi:translocation and assembly module TamB
MKRPLRALVICLIVVLCPVLIVLGLLGTAPGLALSISIVNQLASTQDAKIEISGLDGVLGGSPSVAQVTVADANGIWLTVNEVEMDLSRLALLTGRIDASRLAVKEINVARKPTSSATKDQNSGATGLPPIHARVENVFIRAIALAEPVLGEQAKLQLTGSLLLRDNPVDLSGAVDIVRIDGRSGEFSSDWKVSPDSNELQLNLSVQEPADGLLARAIDIYGLPAVDIRVSGEGPLDDWRSTLAVSLDGQKTVDGSVSLSLTDEKQTINGTLEGVLAPLVPTAATPFFAGKTHIELSAERDGKNTFRIHKFSARSALVGLNATGHILPDTDEVDLKADLTFGSPDSEIAFNLAENTTLKVGYTRISTSIKGSLEKADWMLAGSVKSFTDGRRSFADAQLSGQSSSIDFFAGAGPLEIGLQLASVSSGQSDLDALIGGTVKANISAEIGSGVLTIEKSQVTAQQLEAEVTGQVDLASSVFELQLAATVDKQQTGLWDGLFGQQAARLSGRVARGDDGVLVVSNGAIESGNLQATVNGSVSPDVLQIDSDVSLASLGSLNEGLSGALNATVALTGTTDVPQFDVRAKGADITILDKPLEALSLVASGHVGSSGPSADMELTGRYEEQPISVSASIKTGSDGKPTVETLDIVVPGARARGNLQANSAGILVGAFDLDVSSLAELGPLLLQKGLSGSLTGTVEFSDEGSAQTVQSTLTSQTLDLGAVQLSGTKISAQLTDLQNDLTIDATVTSSAVTASGTSISKVSAVVSGTTQALQFSVDGTLKNAPLSVAGEVSSQHGTTSIEISRGRGSFASIPVELTSPATITLVEQATHVEAVTLKVGQGRVTVQGVATDQLSFDVEVQGLPLSLLEAVAPGGLGQSGTVNASAKISGTASDPAVTYQLTAQNISVAATREAQIPSISIVSSGTFASNILKTTAKASGGGMDLAAGGTVNVGGVPAFDLTITGSAPFEFAAIPLSNAGILLEGGVQVSLAIGGTSKSPQIKGRLSTQNAVFIEENSALTVRDIVGEIDFEGTRANISRLQGRMGSKGTLSVSGSVDLDPANGLPADLKLTVNDGTYSNGEIITTQFDADMSVSGALLRAGAIGGTVTLRRTDINIPERLPSSIPMVDVKHLHASRAVIEQSQEIAPSTGDGGGAENGGVIQLDLKVSAPARIFLRGRGMDAEFGGSLQVYGTTTAPRAKGSFKMVRGRLDILTRRFDFDRGSIIFAGPMDPTLDFQTTTTVSGTSYSIVVGGTASVPDISFSSSPTVPQDEILANLFFGKSLSKLSPLQIAQLANAVSQLSGVSSGEGLLGRLRSLGGLADVDLVPDADGGGTALGVGSYLNDRTYINVEKGLSGNAGKVTIDLDITDNLKARGEAGTDGETKAGIFYEKDY